MTTEGAQTHGQPMPVAPIADVIILTFTWSVLANFSVFFAMYRYRLYCYYIHMFLSWLILVLTIAPVLWIVIQQGILIGGEFDILQSVHNAFGLFVITFVFLQCYSGAVSRVLQENYLIKSINVLRVKKFHRYFGYTMMLFTKFLLTTGWYGKSQTMFIIIVIWQSIWVIMIFLRKVVYVPSLEKNMIVQEVEQQQAIIRKIYDISEIDQTTNFIVFGNYIYDITPLYSNHPAGYQIVGTVKGREIDRFLYGMYSSEKTSEVAPYSHTYKSLQILGNPIAKLEIPSTFRGMRASNICEVVYNLNFSNRFNVIGLRSMNAQTPFQYQGYRYLKQFGQFYAVNIGSTTRLYTTVNCLRHQNLTLISKISANLKDQYQNILPVFEQQKKNSQVNCTERDLNEDIQISHGEIPIMFKKYDTGMLTPIMFNLKQNSQIVVSNQRGVGMRLDTIESGNIIFAAGGTGLCPYMDLIDLLYKSQIAKIESCSKFNLKKLCPILENKKFFQNLKYTFMIALHDIKDIHPLTLFQLKYLVKEHPNFRCIMKVRNKPETFNREYPGFSYVSQNFEFILKRMMKDQQFARIYICGPPPMNEALLQLMEIQHVPSNKYMII